MDNQPVNNEIEKFIQLSKNEKNVKQKNRYDAVLLYLEGHSRHEISEVPTFRAGQCLDTYPFILKAVRKPSSSANSRAALNSYRMSRKRNFSISFPHARLKKPAWEFLQTGQPRRPAAWWRNVSG